MGIQDHATGTDGSTDAAAAEPPISKSELFLLLADPRQRVLVRFLLAREDQDRVEFSTLVGEVAAREHDTTTARVGAEERERTRIACYHKLLPALDDHDMVDYDRSDGIVTPTRLLQIAKPYTGDGIHDDPRESDG